MFAGMILPISKRFFSKGRSVNKATNTGLKSRIRKKLASKKKPVANKTVEQKKIESVSLK